MADEFLEGTGYSRLYLLRSRPQSPKTQLKTTHPNQKAHPMTRFLGFLAAAVASAIGWWLGAKIGFMTAFLLSTLGTGLGLYYGMRAAREWLP